MGLRIPVAGSADRPALVVGVVGVPSDHTMEARRGFSKDVACADQSSHEMLLLPPSVRVDVVDAEGERMLSDRRRDLEASRDGAWLCCR